MSVRAPADAPSRTRRYTPKVKRTRHSADTRHELLLQAADTVVAQQGVPGLTMERLAAAAGVSRALVYQHFANVTELLLELLEREFAWLEPRISSGLDDATSFRDRLIATTKPYLDAKKERSQVFYGLLLTQTSDPGVLATMMDYYRRVLGFWVREAQAEFGIDGDTAVEGAVIFVGGFESAARRHWVLDDSDADEVIDLFVELVLGALRHLARRKGK